LLNCGDYLVGISGSCDSLGNHLADLALARQLLQLMIKWGKERYRYRDGAEESGMRTSVRPAAFWPFCLFGLFAWPGCVMLLLLAMRLLFHLGHLRSSSQRRCHWHDTCINILTACRLRRGLFCSGFSHFFFRCSLNNPVPPQKRRKKVSGEFALIRGWTNWYPVVCSEWHQGLNAGDNSIIWIYGNLKGKGVIFTTKTALIILLNV